MSLTTASTVLSRTPFHRVLERGGRLVIRKIPVHELPIVDDALTGRVEPLHCHHGALLWISEPLPLSERP